MATQEQELNPLNPQPQKQEHNIIVEQPAPRRAQPIAQRPKEPAKVLFRRKLQENDGCCSSWCGAHFFLIYLMLNNIMEICIASYQIIVLQDPYGSHEICYMPSEGGPEQCDDQRSFYESYGLTVAFCSVLIGFSSIHFLTNCGAIWALYNCSPTMFFIQWIMLNIAVIFMLCHTIMTGIYWGLFALLIPMMLACYFWMIYQLAKYFEKGGVYDNDMNYMSPAPNNYAVMYVAKPDDLASYYENHTEFEKPPPDYYKTLFSQKMHEQFDTCCCKCNLMTWSIIWIVYMLFQNSLWLISSIMTTIILYAPYGEYMNCYQYATWVQDPSGEWVSTYPPDDSVDCRALFEDNGLTRGFSITACVIAGLCLLVNGWVLYGIYQCNTTAIIGQVWMLLLQGFFMLLYSIFTGYYYGFFALLIPLLLSCHFYSIYVLAVYCKEEINVRRFPRMQATKPKVVYVTRGPQPQPNQKVVYVQQPMQPQTNQNQQVVYVQQPIQSQIGGQPQTVEMQPPPQPQ